MACRYLKITVVKERWTVATCNLKDGCYAPSSYELNLYCNEVDGSSCSCLVASEKMSPQSFMEELWGYDQA